DIRWCSYPQKVPLTKIAELLQVPYDKTLLANTELREKVLESQYNPPSKQAEIQDCFGLYPDETCATCRICVDYDRCKSFFDSKFLTTLNGSSVMTEDYQEQQDTQQSVETQEADTQPTQQSKTPHRTMMDIAFERLAQGPATTQELMDAISV